VKNIIWDSKTNDYVEKEAEIDAESAMKSTIQSLIKFLEGKDSLKRSEIQFIVRRLKRII
jgi:hypothetical protein